MPRKPSTFQFSRSGPVGSRAAAEWPRKTAFTGMPQKTWVRDLNGDSRVRLFCFPYAGGGASVFREWQPRLPASIQVCPVQLPGRETRWREPPHSRMSTLVRALAEIFPAMLDRPAAFFGHSMGALIAFELARELTRREESMPCHLFLSGARAPQFRSHRTLHKLSDRRLIMELRRLQGMPPQLFDNREFMTMFLPTIRADFAMCETYEFLPGERLSCPLTVYGGTLDEVVSLEELSGWSCHTQGAYELEMLEGDHFFISSAEETLVNQVRHRLVRLEEGSSAGS